MWASPLAMFAGVGMWEFLDDPDEDLRVGAGGIAIRGPIAEAARARQASIDAMLRAVFASERGVFDLEAIRNRGRSIRMPLPGSSFDRS